MSELSLWFLCQSFTVESRLNDHIHVSYNGTSMRSDLIFGFFKLPIDFVMLIAAGAAAYGLRVSPIVSDKFPVLFSLPLFYFFMLVLGVATFFILIFVLGGLYSLENRRHILNELFAVVIVLSFGFMMIILAMFIRREWFDSRFIVIAAWGFGILFVSMGRVGLYSIRRFILSTFGIGTEATILVGSKDKNNLVENVLKKNTHLGLRVVYAYEDMDLSVLNSALSLHSPSRLILTDPNFSREHINELSSFCEEYHIHFSFVPDLFGALSARMSVDVLDGIPLIEIKRTPLGGWGKILKRTFDIVGSSIGLVIFFPIFTVVGIAIKWESKGPMLVKLDRVSQNKEFKIYKFRSMVDNAAQYKPMLVSYNERTDGPLFKMKDDPRITRVGRFLRKGRIDELPQMINVLKGNMSLVGPRPHEPQEVAKYERHHKKVLMIKSGLTGLAQINGAQDLSFEEEVTLDRHYIEHWSLRKDISIILKTFGMFLFDRSGH